jgi:hypothetical protein
MIGTIAALALTLTFAAVVTAVRARRRRHASHGSLDPLPAGIKHLASHVGTLSSFGMGLRVVPAQRNGRRRIGTLLGVR